MNEKQPDDRYRSTSTPMMDEFTKIYELYYSRIYKYICYRINDQHMAEELCSQIFEKIITKYTTFSENQQSFEGWIFAIARNTLTDYYRSKKRNVHFSLDILLNKGASDAPLEEHVISSETNADLFKALKRLNEKERNIVSLKYGAELKNTEIAKLMGISESNVGVILYRSLKKLQKILVAGGFKL